MKRFFKVVGRTIINNLSLIFYAAFLIAVSGVFLVFLYTILRLIIPIVTTIIYWVLLIGIMLLVTFGLLIYICANCSKFSLVGRYAKKHGISRSEARHRFSNKNL